MASIRTLNDLELRCSLMRFDALGWCTCYSDALTFDLLHRKVHWVVLSMFWLQRWLISYAPDDAY